MAAFLPPPSTQGYRPELSIPPNRLRAQAKFKGEYRLLTVFAVPLHHLVCKAIAQWAEMPEVKQHSFYKQWKQWQTKGINETLMYPGIKKALKFFKHYKTTM